MPDAGTRPPVVVTAALIERDGAFLMTKRLRGTHLEGRWEFPGGKVDAGETLAGGLARELREELGVDAVVGEEVLVSTHAYPDVLVELHFLQCVVHGEPAPLIGQAMRWVPRGELAGLAVPDADREMIDRLVSPTTR